MNHVALRILKFAKFAMEKTTLQECLGVVSSKYSNLNSNRVNEVWLFPRKKDGSTPLAIYANRRPDHHPNSPPDIKLIAHTTEVCKRINGHFL